MVTQEQKSLLDTLIEELSKKQQGLKHTTPSGTPTTNYMHGPGGIFGVAGLERDVISTRVHPQGLIEMLQAQGDMKMNPLYPYLTGFQANTGSVADGVCDDPETAGPTKSCIQTAQYGRYSFLTKELEVNRLGQQINRGEFLDLRVLNDPILQDMGGITSMNIDGNPTLVRDTLMGMVEVGVAFQNVLTQQLYQGNPASNSAGGGYSEFPGLDILIGTGKVDAITGTNCPSLDSDIKDFNYGLVTESTPDIVEVVTYMARFLRSNARRMNFNPTEWAITMREELFYELTAIWPCSYLTYRCTPQTAATDRMNIDARDAVGMRDAMRQENYLLIDGIRWPVVVDDGIVEETDADNAAILAGQFASDIYFIPLSVRGGFAATFMQYVDYQQGAMIGVNDWRYTEDFWTDGGRFLWHKKPPTNWCVQLLAKIQPRVILLTPQLAGRVTNVRYAPLQHTRQPFPSDPYFVDGGLTSRTVPSLYSDWNLPE